MNAAENAGDCGTTAAALNDPLFRELTAKLGADTDIARARLLDVDRNDIARWRRGSSMPRLEKAMRVANKLGTTVEDLFGRVAA